MTNPNTNCLEGKKCPSCKSYSPFDIVATSVFTLTDDGTDGHKDVEYDGDSIAYCGSCNHSAKWSAFDDEDLKVKKTYTVIGVYKDREGGRYATSVQATSPEDAEEKAQEVCRKDNSKDEDKGVIDLDLDIGQEKDLLDIAAVIEGDGCKIVA